MIITVFGSSQPIAGDDAYLQAYNLGKLIAMAGHTVVSGGYIGTMEAVSKGAKEAGGHVIGITCADIEQWRKGKANPWVMEEIKCSDLIERLRTLIGICDMAIALPGGPGTLTEISLMWNLMIIEAIPQKKLILVGDGWEKVFNTATTSMSANFLKRQSDMISFAPDIRSIENLLN